MKNKEKYNVEDLKFGMGNHIDNGYVYLFVENDEENWDKEYKVSVLSILQRNIEETIKTFSEVGIDEAEWTCDESDFENDIILVHLFNKERTQEGFVEVSISGMLDAYLDEWYDTWLEEEAEEDE